MSGTYYGIAARWAFKIFYLNKNMKKFSKLLYGDVPWFIFFLTLCTTYESEVVQKHQMETKGQNDNLHKSSSLWSHFCGYACTWNMRVSFPTVLWKTSRKQTWLNVEIKALYRLRKLELGILRSTFHVIHGKKKRYLFFEVDSFLLNFKQQKCCTKKELTLLAFVGDILLQQLLTPAEIRRHLLPRRRQHHNRHLY